jgi:thiamine kinase-like enzyme
MLVDIKRLKVGVPDGYMETYARIAIVKAAMERTKGPYVPSHIDPLAENFLDDGEMVRIVDFEYSANYDPMWDVGDFSVEAELGETQEQALMQSYFGSRPSDFHWGRMVMSKLLCDVCWCLVGVVHFGNKNPVIDWWAYAVNRHERAKRLLASASFARHLEAVERGEA